MNQPSSAANHLPPQPWYVRREMLFCLLLAVIAMLLCLPAVLLDKTPANDVASRYAPMVRELAAGNWDRVLLARVQPLMIIGAAALTALFGLDPYLALKIESALFFALTVFPLYFLYRRAFGMAVARWSIPGFILCSRILRYAGAGLRETGKIFFLILGLYGLICFVQNRSWRGALYIALGAAGLSLVRGEALIFAIMLLLGLLATDVVRHGQKAQCTIQFPRRAIAACTLWLLLMAPWMAYQYRVTGYPVTDFRQAVVIYDAARQLGIELPAPQLDGLDPRLRNKWLGNDEADENQ